MRLRVAEIILAPVHVACSGNVQATGCTLGANETSQKLAPVSQNSLEGALFVCFAETK